MRGKRPPVVQKGTGTGDKPKTLTSAEKSAKRNYRFIPGTKALKEICRFQESTKLLIPKMAFYCVVCEILQQERSWCKIQASPILALHEVAKTYLVHLFEDGNLCAIHTKYITIMLKDKQLA